MVAQRKPQTPITVLATVGEDHRLVIDIPLPPDVPSGQVKVELVVRATETEQDKPAHSALEAAREKMRTKGRLSTAWNEGSTGAVLDDEVLWNFVKLAPNSPSSEQLINEDRGDY